MATMYEKQIVKNGNDQGRLKVPVHPGSAILRRALRSNIVSFPSQTPTFLKQPAADLQWRIVLLFFVRGWSGVNIAARFNVPKHQVWKALNEWSIRALALGFIQVIDAEAFGACCGIDFEEPEDRNSGEALLAGSHPIDSTVSPPFSEVVAALEHGQSTGQSDGLQRGESHFQGGLGLREEEEVFHAGV